MILNLLPKPPNSQGAYYFKPKNSEKIVCVQLVLIGKRLCDEVTHVPVTAFYGTWSRRLVPADYSKAAFMEALELKEKNPELSPEHLWQLCSLKHFSS